MNVGDKAVRYADGEKMQPSPRSLIAAAFEVALFGGAGAGLMYASLKAGALAGALMAGCVAACGITSAQ